VPHQVVAAYPDAVGLGERHDLVGRAEVERAAGGLRGVPPARAGAVVAAVTPFHFMLFLQSPKSPPGPIFGPWRVTPSLVVVTSAGHRRATARTRGGQAGAAVSGIRRR
jgi:hypothetical protein